MGLIRVRAEKNIWFEPEPGKGRLYLKGEEFMLDTDRFQFSDFHAEKTEKGKDGKPYKFRGSMSRVLPEPLVVAQAEKAPEPKAASRKVI